MRKWLLPLLLCPAVAAAAGDFTPPSCAGAPPAPPRLQPAPATGTGPRVLVEADEARVERGGLGIYRGDVRLQYDGLWLGADLLRYDDATGRVEAEGGVRLVRGGLDLQGERLHWLLQTGHGALDKARYFATDRGGRGRADRIAVEGRRLLKLESASYTTCDPADPDWLLSASRITIDRDTQQGHARNVVLKFKGLPLLYLPYLRFPAGNERLSGFLFPSVGESERLGTEVRIPYYWNIAPDMDATLTPRHMTRRGTMLEGEFRYLTPRSNGEIRGAWLPDDRVARRERGELGWRHRTRWDNGWSASLDLATVTDPDYLQDFGSTLASTSLTHLEQRGEVNWTSARWTFTARAQGYKTLTGTPPFQRLPQLVLSRTRDPGDGLHWLLDAELVNFDHSSRTPTGTRLDLQPGVAWRWSRSWGHLEPRLVWRQTAWKLRDTAPGQDPEPSRGLPVFSLDGGLVFERGTTVIQTLEPRLKYIYVPERDQDDLPNFDSAPLTPTLDLLFAEYQFTGADRVAAANRVAASVFTRWFDGRGRELAAAGLGQSFDLETRPGEPATSNLFGEFSARPDPRWDLSLRMEWDPRLSTARQHNARIRFQSRRGDVVNLRYRRVRGELENWDAGLLWKSSSRWQRLALRQHDLLAGRDTDTAVGFQYDSCCWGVRVVWREFVTDTTGIRDRGVYLELALKGLSSLGSRRQISDLLERGILP